MSKPTYTATTGYQVLPFVGTDDPVSSPCYLLPPGFTYGAKTDVFVPFVYRAGPKEWPKAVYANPDFSFSLLARRGDPNQPPYLCVDAKITVSANAWKTAPAARQAFTQNFADLCAKLEAQFELAAPAILFPGAASTIGQQLAERLPAPIGETLFHAYGLVPGTAPGTGPSVDLRPGMRLRVELEASQFVSPGSPFNGYVGAGTSVYEVCSVPDGKGGRKLAFDAFLGSVAAPQIGAGAGAVPLAGGLPDLQRSGGARRYWRLVQPQSMIAADSPGDGSLAKNPTLIGADTLADLGAATAAYVKSGTRVASTATYVVFRGRAVVVPEIAVSIAAGGSTQIVHVPVGTTVAHVLDRWSGYSAFQNESAVSLQRLVTNLGPGGRGTVRSPVAVAFSTAGGPPQDPWIFDLPLLRGDKLVL